MPGFTSLDYIHGTRLVGTAAVAFAKGLPGAGGVARDSLLFRVYIPLNATAATLTVTGLNDSGGVAASWVINGQTTLDVNLGFDCPLLNEFAGFTFQPSVTNLIWVFTRPFTGP